MDESHPSACSAALPRKSFNHSVPTENQTAEGPDAAREIVTGVLGRDPGPMAAARSDSHHVYVGTHVVVKIIDAERHARLDREIALAPHLPTGMTAPLLTSGLYRLGVRHIRYACYARVSGTTPGMGLPDVDGLTARVLAENAVRHLGGLHSWIPADHAQRTLREPLDHGGFVSRAALVADIDTLARTDRSGFVAGHLLDGLAVIADRAPIYARAVVPVHADCHWGNWLACDGKVTALLDFEWARFGEPLDDWFFLARYGGPHMEVVLDVIAHATAIPVEFLRSECEVREAAHLVSDLRTALERADTPSPTAVGRLRALEELIVGQYWWCQAS
jgi:hypothetical protein